MISPPFAQWATPAYDTGLQRLRVANASLLRPLHLQGFRFRPRDERLNSPMESRHSSPPSFRAELFSKERTPTLLPSDTSYEKLLRNSPSGDVLPEDRPD
jgi:hypothetical protein